MLLKLKTKLWSRWRRFLFVIILGHKKNPISVMNVLLFLKMKRRTNDPGSDMLFALCSSSPLFLCLLSSLCSLFLLFARPAVSFPSRDRTQQHLPSTHPVCFTYSTCQVGVPMLNAAYTVYFRALLYFRSSSKSTKTRIKTWNKHDLTTNKDVQLSERLVAVIKVFVCAGGGKMLE